MDQQTVDIEEAESVEAILENAERDGEIEHSIECDIYFSAYVSETASKHGEIHTYHEIRQCECEREYLEGIEIEWPFGD